MDMNKRGITLLIIPILVVLVLVLGAALYLQQQTPPISQVNQTPSPTTTNQNANQLKTFKSSNIMNFEVAIPADFTAEEKFGSVDISSPSGKIIVGTYGTEFNDIESHLENLNSLNKSEILETKKITISGYDTVIQTIKWPRSPSGKLIEYLIYVDGQVYTFSTDAEPLFTTLDQIAKSFRYTPQ